MENSFRDEKKIFELQVDETVKATMLETSRWAMFLAIIGFIYLALMVLGGVIAGVAISAISSAYPTSDPSSAIIGVLGGAGITAIYLISAGLMFYPVFALSKFASHIKVAIQTFNQDRFRSAMSYLKNMFKYCGILTIVCFALIILLVVLIGVSASA
jgi:hypothetical protein